MARMVEVRAQTRAKLTSQVLEAINKNGEDKFLTLIYDEGGKFATGLLASMRAYLYFRD